MSLPKWLPRARTFAFLAVFALILSFLIWQHSTGISWDFSTYNLNARYLFGQGTYFEWERPPLIPFIMGITGFTGWKTTEYIFIVLVTALHLFSCIRLSKKTGMDPLVYYILSASPFLLLHGLSVGSELLTLSMLQLFISELDTNYAGIFLGLSFLTRYPSLVFSPLLISSKSWKKLIANIGLFFLVISPWLIYNFLGTGSPFTSIISSIMMNMKLRYAVPAFEIKKILIVTNYMLLPMLVGIGILIKERGFKKEQWVFVALAALCILSFIRIPFQDPRYLFNLLIPTAYFAYVMVSRIRPLKIGAVIFLAINISIMANICLNMPTLAILEDPTPYKTAISDLDGCMALSNAWVFLQYYGIPSGPPPWPQQLDEVVTQGQRLLFFKKIADPPYSRDQELLSQYPIMKESGQFLLLGDETACMPPSIVNETYIKRFSEAIGEEISLQDALTKTY